jgi:hypothetical protein
MNQEWHSQPVEDPNPFEIIVNDGRGQQAPQAFDIQGQTDAFGRSVMPDALPPLTEPGQTETEGLTMEVHHDEPRDGLVPTPDHTRRIEKWWGEPEQPAGRIDLTAEQINTNLLTQIAESPAEGGRQSCFLASQLNAYVLRGAITPQEARKVQVTALMDANYGQFWEDQTFAGNDFTGWSGSPATTAYVISEVTGKTMNFHDNAGSEMGVATIPALLQRGYALVLNGARHARVVCMPEGEDRPYVFDSLDPSATGFYDMEVVQGLQENSYFVTI